MEKNGSEKNGQRPHPGQRMGVVEMMTEATPTGRVWAGRNVDSGGGGGGRGGGVRAGVRKVV